MSSLSFARLLVAACSVLATATAAPVTSMAADASAPKAYIGLFKDDAVAVLDTSTNQVVKRISIPAGPHGLVVTPDGEYVYISSDEDSVVSVIDTTTDEVVSSIDVGPTPHGLAITPDGSEVLVAGFGTDQVEAIDTHSNQVVWRVPVGQPHNIAITPDGKTAYAGSQKQGSESLAILDLASGAQTGSLPLQHAPRALNISPDGKRLAYTLAGVDALQVIDLTSNQPLPEIATGVSPHHPLFTPDGKLGMVVSQGPGTLDLFDPAANATTGTVKVGTMPHWIGLSPDARTAYVTNENSNDVSVVDLTGRKVTATVPVGNAPRKIVVQPGAAGATAASGAPVLIAKFAYAPANLTVARGQTVTFTNSDGVTHTVTADGFDSGDIAPGATFTMTANQPGTVTYHCSIHPFMRGTLTVQG